MEECRRLIEMNVNGLYQVNPSFEKMNRYKRIISVTTYLFLQPDLHVDFTAGLERLLNDMLYHPPWDNEMPIHEDLERLINLCYQYRPNDALLAETFAKDLKDITVPDLLTSWLSKNKT